MTPDPEQSKYARLYAKRGGAYGHRNHGAGSYDYFPAGSHILDVGCGHNEFVKAMKERGYFGVGVDFACDQCTCMCSILDLSVWYPEDPDDIFDYVTAFDVLEHLHPDTLDAALAEMAKVAPRYVVSVGTFPAGDLHLIVQPFSWWLEKLRSVSDECEPWGMSEGSGKREPYIVGRWKQ